MGPNETWGTVMEQYITLLATLLYSTLLYSTHFYCTLLKFSYVMSLANHKIVVIYTRIECCVTYYSNMTVV